MAHPAKYSSKLIRHIYEHMLAEGWVKAGDSVIDPFGGIGLGALDSMRLGLNWYGVELEPRFVDLGNKNIDLWNSKFGTMPRWGSAQLRQGDSRRLLEVLGVEPAAVVSNPPYADGSQHTGGDDLHPEKLQGGMYYGVGLAGAVSSPPYAGNLEKKGGIDPMKSNYKGGPHSQVNNSDTRYGDSIGQLGAMKGNGFEAAISSPPFLQSEGGTKTMEYGNTDGQIAASDDFGWPPARSSSRSIWRSSRWTCGLGCKELRQEQTDRAFL
jgi:hypothetical protein